MIKHLQVLYRYSPIMELNEREEDNHICEKSVTVILLFK